MTHPEGSSESEQEYKGDVNVAPEGEEVPQGRIKTAYLQVPATAQAEVSGARIKTAKLSITAKSRGFGARKP